MPVLRVPICVVTSGQLYQARADGRVTVGEVARYLSALESSVEVSTLEIARLARPEQQVDELDIQSGDRLLVFTTPLRAVELTSPALLGDKEVHFRAGDTVIRSGGKRSLTVGKAEAEFIPDVDLRHFIAARLLELVSADCLRLYFDEAARLWTIGRSGTTRVMVDELELEGRPLVLNDAQWVRFYRVGDTRPIGEMRVTLETAAGAAHSGLPSGSEVVKMSIGLENENEMLRTSESIRAEQIAGGLAQVYGLPSDAQLYVTRLVSPYVPLEAARLGADEFFYAALNRRRAPNALTLRDFHQPERVYALLPSGEEKRVGSRASGETALPDLEIDLYDSIMAAGYDPRPFQGISPYYACIHYRAAAESWWIRLDERAQVPVFVNHTRLTRQTPLTLMAGDVVSIGPSLNHYYARLEVGD